MPRADDLPDSLKKLSHWNALAISHSRFDADVERLARDVSQQVEARRPSEATAPERPVRQEREEPATEGAEETPVGAAAQVVQPAENWLGRLVARVRRAAADGSAAGAAAYSRVRSGLTQPEPKSAYFDQLGGRVGEPRDRLGRPLPWRWSRSLSRDLLGPYGLAILCAAIAIKAVSYVPLTPPNTPNVSPNQSGVPPQELAPSTLPQAKSPYSTPDQKAPSAPRKVVPAEVEPSQRAAPTNSSQPQQQSDAGSGVPAQSAPADGLRVPTPVPAPANPSVVPQQAKGKIPSQSRPTMAK